MSGVVTEPVEPARGDETSRPSTREGTEVECDVGIPISIMTVVALLTVVTLELVRATGPLLEIAFDVSVVAVAGTSIATYLGSGVIGLVLVTLARRSGEPTALLVGTVALAIARVIAQGTSGTTRFAVGLVTIATAIAVFAFAVAVLAGRRRGAGAVATAIASGAAFGVGIQLALGTWDAFWRHTAVGWSVTVAVLAGLVVAAQRGRADPTARPTRYAGRMWVLGPALSLMVMVTANSGFAAAQSGVRLSIAGPVVAAGLLIAGASVPIVAQRPGTRRALPASVSERVIAFVPGAVIAGVFWVNGPAVLVLIVGAQVASVAVLVLTFERSTVRRSQRSPTPARSAVAAALVGLGTIVPLLVFQLDYDIPLGFPNELVIVATAAVFGAATIGRRDVTPHGILATSASPPHRVIDRSTAVVLVAAGAIVLLGTTFAVVGEVRTDPEPDLASDRLTLVSWNVHYGVGPHADVDLEQIARTIELQNPSVVTLQEVSRGWVLGGGTDMATWLAQRLRMNVAFAPAADRQFGNAILTNLPTTNVTAIELPYGNGPQQRSAISADIDTPNGTMRVTSVHLQNKSHIPTRLDQIDTLLDAQADAPILIIAGDFNARPGSAEINQMTDAGLVSAQDVSGDPTALTDPSINPDKRIDWVFGRGVTFTSTEVLADALSSDHLPLVVALTDE